MDTFRILRSRVLALFGRSQQDAQLEEELRSHIELAVDENIARGMNPLQARREALRSFGGLTQVREQYRLQRGIPLLEQVGRDLRFAMRQLSRNPGFALTAILTLGLGLGANTAVFSLINALLLRPLPVPHAEGLTVLNYTRSDLASSNFNFSYPLFQAIEKNHAAFEEVAAYNGTEMQVRGKNGSVTVFGDLVSGQFFSILQTPATLGRYLTRQDDRTGNPDGFPVVLAESFWAAWFHRDPQVLGRKLTIANVPFTVVGVMPAKFLGADLTRRPQIFLPLSAEPLMDAPYNNLASGNNSWWLQVLARRSSAVSLKQGNAALAASTTSMIAEAAPTSDWAKNHFQINAITGSRGYNDLRESFREPLLIVLCLCGGTLLLACLNLASLLVARSASRERELATRLAVGATRRQLVSQLLIESLLIALLGTIAGLAASPLVSRTLTAMLIGTNPDTVLDAGIDLRVFGFAAAVAVCAGLSIGLIPALRATSGDLNSQMRNGSVTTTIRKEKRMLPHLLMGSEIAIALTLLVGAGLLAASLMRLYSAGLGFEPSGLIHLSLNMDKQALEGESLMRWYQGLGEALHQLPGVRSVSFEEIPPLSGSWTKSNFKTPVSHGEQNLFGNEVAPDYFATMHIPMPSGRDFQWTDTRSSTPKIILNESAARVLFQNGNALGQLVDAGRKQAYEVIAVVGDVHYASVRDKAPPTAYRAIMQSDVQKGSYVADVRLDGAVAPFAYAAQNLVAGMAPEIPAPVLTTMSSELDTSIASERIMATLAMFFAACALLVTGIGLYGTLAYATARRTSEIGIRMALGARRVQVVLLVFRENLWSTALGALAGLGIALAGARVLASFLYGTSVHDPWVMAGAVTALAVIASAASLLPALRAARIEPMQALRAE